MSSHHIIREKQEPALLVLGLDNFTDELLGQLLEWSPTLLVTPATAEQLNAFGIKFDILISNDKDDEVNLQSDVKHISSDRKSVSEAALQYLVAHGYPAVNIVTDNLTLSEYVAFAGQINIVLFHHSKKIYPVTNGFSKWQQAGEQIELLTPPDGLRTTGLETTGNNLYKTTHDGFFTLQFTPPFTFIAESIA